MGKTKALQDNGRANAGAFPAAPAVLRD